MKEGFGICIVDPSYSDTGELVTKQCLKNRDTAKEFQNKMMRPFKQTYLLSPKKFIKYSRFFENVNMLRSTTFQISESQAYSAFFDLSP